MGKLAVAAIFGMIGADPLLDEFFNDNWEIKLKTKEEIKKEKKKEKMNARNAAKSREVLKAKAAKAAKVRAEQEERKLLHDNIIINGPKRHVLPNSDLRGISKNPIMKKIGYKRTLQNMAATIAKQRADKLAREAQTAPTQTTTIEQTDTVGELNEAEQVR